MKLRPFDPETDFDRIVSWNADERAYAMWCANRFRYPPDRSDFTGVLAAMARRTGDVPLTATTDDGRAAGFFCYSLNREKKEGKLKFVIVDPEVRGKGFAREMLRLALAYAFRDPEAERVSLSVFSPNIRAKKCYEKAGFHERSTDAGAFAFRDETWDRCNMVTEAAAAGAAASGNE